MAENFKRISFVKLKEISVFYCKGISFNKIEGNIFLKVFCYEIDEFMKNDFFFPKRNLKGSPKIWAFWSTNKGGGIYCARDQRSLPRFQ